MGEHIFRVLLQDISVVRVTCCSCQAAVEVKLDKLAQTFRLGKCLGCGDKLTRQDGSGELGELEGAILSLTQNSALEIEFPIKLPKPN
jgi:hypothetical protein